MCTNTVSYVSSPVKAQHKGACASMDKNIKREKLALENIDHPNIIKLLAVYEAAQTVCILELPYKLLDKSFLGSVSQKNCIFQVI